MLSIARQVVSSKVPVMTVAVSRVLSSFQRPFSTSMGDIFHVKEKVEEDRYIRKIEHRDMANPQWNSTPPAAAVTPEQQAMQEIRQMLNSKDYLTYPTLEALVQWKLNK